MCSESLSCLLGQQSSCSTFQQPVELSENILQNLFHNLMPHSFGKISCLTVRGHSDPEKLFLCFYGELDSRKEQSTNALSSLHAGRMHGLLSIAHPHQRFSHPPKRFSIYLFFAFFLVLYQFTKLRMC